MSNRLKRTVNPRGVDVTRTLADPVLGHGPGAGDVATLAVEVAGVIRSIAAVDPEADLTRGLILAIGVVVAAMMMRTIERSRVVIGDRGPTLRRGIKREVIVPDRAHIQSQEQDLEPDRVPGTPAESIPRSTTARVLGPDRVPPPTTESPRVPTRSPRVAVPALPAPVAPDRDPDQLEEKATLPATLTPHHRPHTRSQRKSQRSLRSRSHSTLQTLHTYYTKHNAISPSSSYFFINILRTGELK